MKHTIHFVSHALGYGHSGDSPWLRTRDHLSLEVWLVAVTHKLGYPGGVGLPKRIDAESQTPTVLFFPILFRRHRGRPGFCQTLNEKGLAEGRLLESTPRAIGESTDHLVE